MLELMFYGLSTAGGHGGHMRVKGETWGHDDNTGAKGYEAVEGRGRVCDTPPNLATGGRHLPHTPTEPATDPAGTISVPSRPRPRRGLRPGIGDVYLCHEITDNAATCRSPSSSS